MKQKKRITSQRVTKGLIVGFFSYGLIVGFIYCAFIAFIYSYFQSKTVNQNNPIIVTAFATALISVGIVLLNRGICMLSTMDVLKRAKLSENTLKKSTSSMGTFFLCLMIIIVIFLNYFLLMNVISEKNQLMFSRYQLSSSGFTQTTVESIFEKEVSDYELAKQCMLLRIVILEFAFIISFVSLMPYQKKLLKKYNGTFDAPIQDVSTDSI